MDEQFYKDQKPITAYNVDVDLGTVFTCLFQNNVKLETQLVGYEHDKFFLLKFPTISGISNYLVRDSNFSALFKSHGHNVTFMSSLTNVIPRKFLAFCAYPERFKVYEIRSSARTACLLPCAVTIGIEKYFGVVQDISIDGCKLSLDGIQGTRLRDIQREQKIQIEMWTQKDNIVVNAVVMRVLSSISRVSLGLCFGNLSKQDSAIIQSFVQSLQYSGTGSNDESD